MNAQEFRELQRQARLRELESYPSTTHFKHAFSLTLAPAKGTQTIATATNVFQGHINECFLLPSVNQSSSDTNATVLDVLDMTEDGDYKTLFASFWRDLFSICLSQGQIVNFCLTYPEYLRKNAYGTLFLFSVKCSNSEGHELLVAEVRVCAGRLHALLYPYRDKYVWDKRFSHRLVVPKGLPIQSSL